MNDLPGKEQCFSETHYELPHRKKALPPPLLRRQGPYVKQKGRHTLKVMVFLLATNQKRKASKPSNRQPCLAMHSMTMADLANSISGRDGLTELCIHVFLECRKGAIIQGC